MDNITLRIRSVCVILLLLIALPALAQDIVVSDYESGGLHYELYDNFQATVIPSKTTRKALVNQYTNMVIAYEDRYEIVSQSGSIDMMDPSQTFPDEMTSSSMIVMVDGQQFTVDGVEYAIKDVEVNGVYTESAYDIPESITISDNESYNGTYTVTVIGTEAFSGTSAGSITFPSTIIAIDEEAFCNAEYISSIDLSKTSLTTIGKKAFYSSAITGISLPSTVVTIDEYAFCACTKLTDFTFPEKVTNISKGVFQSCIALETMKIPITITSIGEYAFYGCEKLSSVEIPSSITSVGTYAFCACSALTEISLPSSVRTIEDGAFMRSGLTKISLPESVTSIGGDAFYDCPNLVSVEIPSALTSIGAYSFAYNSKLTYITCNAEVAPSLGDKAFYESGSVVISVPIASKQSYSSADAWNSLTNVEYVSEYTRSTKANKFGTICLPYSYMPTNATLYSVDKVGDTSVTLTAVTMGSANTPYIYQATEDAPNFNFDAATTKLSDESLSEAPTDENGYLTGSFYDGTTYAPADSYVLQTQDGEQAFYKVESDKTISILPHRAYLTTSLSNAALRIGLSDEEGTPTAVDAIRSLTGDNPVIYDLNGRRLQTLQKGINIVNGVKVYVK